MIESAAAQYGPVTSGGASEYFVSLKFTDDGAKAFGDATTRLAASKGTISIWLDLSRYLLLSGQIWRIITFVFIPSYGGSILSAVLGIYFTWFIGTALEREWGDFRYTVYLLSGILGTVLACLLTGVSGSTYCLSLSLLLAFAMLYPEVQVLLFFVIPVRVKYFGVFAGILWVLSFLGAPLPQKLSLLLSMANVWLFFGPMNYFLICISTSFTLFLSFKIPSPSNICITSTIP